ncbi:hypothetical protein G5I_07271 [Acromyrmex echinatior]|uniref:Uncharacterized protein n=1 Tax=Acromyrmex echinatior TaxID=103372 RepID=F4WNB6_ACREC|nr:hypothetical protein G5I_07271 [Acromyrmex echinatior]
MAAMLKSAKYNRTAAIIEGLLAGNGNNSLLWISEINYDDKIYSFRTVQRRFQYTSEEESLERTHREDLSTSLVERAQALISDDPGQLLRVLMDVTTSICFGPRNSGPDLNPSDYYVWNVVERVTNKSRHSNVTSLRILRQHVRWHGQRYITECVRTFQTENRGRHSS